MMSNLSPACTILCGLKVLCPLLLVVGITIINSIINDRNRHGIGLVNVLILSKLHLLRHYLHKALNLQVNLTWHAHFK